jgi:flavin prenyltransferase
MNKDMDKKPFVLAITGASGSIYGLRLLQYLLMQDQPVELVVSHAALRVMQEENGLLFGNALKVEMLEHLNLPTSAPLTVHSLTDYGASIASGSYKTMGMAVVPCSLEPLLSVLKKNVS